MKIIIKTNIDLEKIDIWKVSQVWFYNSGQKIQRQAQANAPYQTGKLKQSIWVDPWIITKDTKSIRIWLRKVIYATIREFYNKKNPDRRFYMKRAFEKAEDIIKEEFNKALKIIVIKK